MAVSTKISFGTQISKKKKSISRNKKKGIWRSMLQPKVILCQWKWRYSPIYCRLAGPFRLQILLVTQLTRFIERNFCITDYRRPFKNSMSKNKNWQAKYHLMILLKILPVQYYGNSKSLLVIFLNSESSGDDKIQHHCL